MQFDCSYGVMYDEVKDTEELRMTIDSVSVIPKETTNADTIYLAERDQLGKVRPSTYKGETCFHVQQSSFSPFQPNLCVGRSSMPVHTILLCTPL